MASFLNAQEITMGSLGYSDFSVEGEETIECEDYSFSIPSKYLEEDEYSIFSVESTFYPVMDESLKITLNFNESGPITLWGSDFHCSNNLCWARPIVSRTRLQENNVVEICGTTTEVTQRIVIFKDSKIGFYKTPIFTLDKQSPETIYLGEKAEMNIIVKNMGSKDANVFIQFISPTGKKVVKIDSFDIVEGESTATTNIAAGETREFIYYIKPTQESSYNLPSAVLFYENIFGEEEKLYSNHPVLNVVKPERLETFIVGSTPENNEFSFKVVVKNLWDEPFTGQLRISHEDHVEGALSQIILPANGEKEFEFKTNTLPTGDYQFFAVVEDETDSATSDSITFSIENEEVAEEVSFAIAGIIVAVVLFSVIFIFWKESKN